MKKRPVVKPIMSFQQLKALQKGDQFISPDGILWTVKWVSENDIVSTNGCIESYYSYDSQLYPPTKENVAFAEFLQQVRGRVHDYYNNQRERIATEQFSVVTSLTMDSPEKHLMSWNQMS